MFIEVVMKNTAEAVIIPLKGGISSLNEVYQALIEADVDPITGKCSNYDYIIQQIEQAHQLLEQSEQAASPAMIISGAVELDQANNAVQVAQEEVRKSENEMRKYEAEFQEKVRSAINLLGVLSGRVRVAEHQTRRFYPPRACDEGDGGCDEGIKQITGNELLYYNDLPRLIDQMKESNQRLADICASENQGLADICASENSSKKNTRRTCCCCC
ncbi:hypothetical protein QTP86_016487, partial [Hemibagrus guttatus]